MRARVSGTYMVGIQNEYFGSTRWKLFWNWMNSRDMGSLADEAGPAYFKLTPAILASSNLLRNSTVYTDGWARLEGRAGEQLGKLRAEREAKAIMPGKLRAEREAKATMKLAGRDKSQMCNLHVIG
ncbi:hypothetical protein THAOC_18812 [Thalassiosira oceanica]|uniref:Uncharacterized protein n=1 Tax=Thalassiosira oceanica TaxID=159749 RepID=K0SID7_THAOC|nr:hypothetical protein THAOC_18812 [Thalassiosira oceanica]|eukprot:EJK60776.1 hypothetical protein THAOC_18812 [Thalassiosira oceanica]